MLSSVMTARLLAPSGKGLLTLLLMIPWLTTVLGRMGIGHAINYYSARVDPHVLFVNVLVLSGTISIVLVAIASSIVYFVFPTILHGASTFAIAGTMVLIPLYLYNDSLVNALLGSYRISQKNRLLIGQALIMLLLTATLALFHRISVTYILLVTIIGLVCFIIGAVFILMPKAYPGIRAFDPSLVKDLLKFGCKAHWGNILIDLSHRGDILIIGSLLSPYYVGCYAVAVMIAELLWKVPDAVGSTLLARVSKMPADEARQFTPRVCRLMLFYMLISTGIMFALGKWVVLVFFGAAYRDSIMVLMLLLPGILCFAIWKILASDLIAQGYPSKYSYSSTLSLFVMVALDLLLIPRWGINGAAIASTFAYITATSSIVYIYLKITKTDLIDIIKPNPKDFVHLKAVFGVSK